MNDCIFTEQRPTHGATGSSFGSVVRLTQTEVSCIFLQIPVSMGSHSQPNIESPLMTLTREAITRSVSDRLGLSRAASARTVETTFEIIKKTLENGEDVLIRGFGKFCIKDKGRRRGRNPVTGEDLMLVERRVVTFKCSGVLKRRLNGGRG